MPAELAINYGVNPEAYKPPLNFKPKRADQGQYSVVHDSRRFTALMATQDEPDFEKRLAMETAYIRAQLKTDLGERLKVSKSEFTYEIRNGLLYEPGRNEPFQSVMERGYKDASRRGVDTPRESVEFQTWKTMQAILASPDTAEGTMVLDFSPRGEKGTNYGDDYIDAHVRRGDTVVSARYQSDLSRQECRDRIVRLNPYYDQVLPQNPTDIDIKTTPVILPAHLGHVNPDLLIQSLLGKNIGSSQEHLDQVDADLAPLIISYINTLVEHPEALYELEEGYEVFLGGAHLSSEYYKKLEARGVIFESHIASGLSFSGTQFEIKMLAEESKNMAGGACGSGGCSTPDGALSESVPSSPLDNLDGRGKVHFRCPRCKSINRRELFEYVTQCQNMECGTTDVLPQSVKEKLGLSKVN